MLKAVLEVMELLDNPDASGQDVRRWLQAKGDVSVDVQQVRGANGATDFVSVTIPGTDAGAPTLGIIGRLGGVGAFPEKLGLVSDADGALVALSSAATLARMHSVGCALPGTVIVTTHVCPRAPTEAHEPTPFMGSPVDMTVMNNHEVHPTMDAVLSVDTTKGNWVANRRGFAITPTVKEGYILPVSPSLLDIMAVVTNEPPFVLPLATQDITPYGNDLYHVNSILQPSTATPAPVVGVATTAIVPVAGCATGANQPTDLDRAGRFCVEVAKAFTSGGCAFYDPEEFERLVAQYGSMRHLQSEGRCRGG